MSVVRVTEEMVLNWLNWDGFKYEVRDDGEGGKVVIAANDVLVNEFRLYSMIDYLNNEIAKQTDEYESEISSVKSRLSYLETQFKQLVKEKEDGK